MTLETIESGNSLEARMTYAKALAEASIIPKAFQRRPADVLVAIEYGNALGIAPIVALSEINVINGTPSLSASLMASLARQAGHIVRITTTEDPYTATCTIIRADDPEFEHVVTWDKERAQQNQLWGKGFWVKDPRVMLQWRAISGCVRSACPEVLAGLKYSTDEVQDFAPTVSQVAAPTAESQPRGVAGALANARSKRQPEPEAPAPAGDGITEAQSSKLWVALRGAQLEDRDDALAAIGNIIDRPIASTKDLTRDEASRVIDALEADQQWSNADPETGEVFDSEIVTDEADR